MSASWLPCCARCGEGVELGEQVSTMGPPRPWMPTGYGSGVGFRTSVVVHAKCKPLYETLQDIDEAFDARPAR